MRGFNIAEQGHIVQITAPVDVTGGATGQCFGMAKYHHASIIVAIGASAAAFTAIIVKQCTASDGTGATAIPFSIYKQETAGASHDVLGARTAVAAAGYAPSANDAIFYVIELDASELADGSPWVQVVLTNGTNSVIAGIFAVLSGPRYANTQAPTDAA